MNNCKPVQKEVCLPPDNLQLKAICFPSLSMLSSLFDNLVINQNSNLVISKNGDPFSKYISPNGNLSEVNSGHWY